MTEFIDRCVAAAADLSLFFVGAPEDQMLAALHGVRANLEGELAQTFGPDVAGVIAAAFVATVIRRRREIEAAGDTTPVVC
jgi:hypothetical protein